ncbi:MAG: FHA domain-containing protein, partial [Myxococcota bacterium]
MRQSRDSSRPAASSSGRLGEVQVFQHKTGELELIAPLSQHHIVVGRNADAAICLDHETVSRNHAELICGPFGQWWVHDLESTNGTYVNGSRVRDRLLNPGDAIRIGRFVLYLKLPEQRPRVDTHHPEERSEHIPPSRPSTWTRPPSGSRPELTTVMALPVGAPREISAAHLARTITLRKQLMGIEDARGRLELVCDFIVADEFPSHSAAIVRLHGPEDPRLVVPPRSRTGSPALSELSRTVLHALWNTRDSVVATNLDEGEQASITPAQSKRRRKLTLPRQERALAVVACPLAEDEERIDSLYVELPGPYGTDEWRTLLALIADAYSQVELVWEMRDHVRSSAFVERELEMARQIQDGLIPTQTQFPHLEVAIGYEPSRWVGGDYVDAVVLADRRILLAIADVCGKG